MKSLIYTAAGLMLASVALAGQAANPNSREVDEPGRSDRAGAGHLQCQFDTSKGLFVIHGPSRLGANRARIVSTIWSRTASTTKPGSSASCRTSWRSSESTATRRSRRPGAARR